MIRWLKKFFFSKVIRNSIWLISDKLCRLIGGLLVGAWVARYLGPDNYGVINFAVSFSAIFISFSMLGIDNLVIRDLSKEKADANCILGTAIRIRNFGSVFSALISILCAYIFYYQSNPVFVNILVILMIGNIFQSMDVISLWYQSRIESKVIVKNKLAAYVVVSILKIVAIILGMDVYVFAILTVLESLFGILLLYRYFILADKINVKRWLFFNSYAKKLLKEGWTLAISNFTILIYMKIDQIFIGTLLGNKAVGIYSVASMISDILYSVPMFIAASVFPKITKLYETNRIVYVNYIDKVFHGITFYSYIAMLGVYLFSGVFISSLYGAAYEESVFITKIHAMTLIFVSIGVIRGNMLIIEHKSSILLMTTLIGGIVNVALSYICIINYGLYGAAAAILITQCIVCYLLGIVYKPLREIFILQSKALVFYSFWRNIVKR